MTGVLPGHNGWSVAMQNEDDHIRLDTRLAGQLKRYHTWPIIGQQTIAEHTWQLLRIYFSVIDKPEMRHVYYLMFHDVGELAVGDIPYPVKQNNPILKEEMDWLEHKSLMAQLEYWDAYRMLPLGDDDRTFLKHIELMEMAEFGMDQVILGNDTGLIIADRCLKSIFTSSPCARLCIYVIMRLGLFTRQRISRLTWEWDKWWIVEQWEGLNASE
jgi:HD containing hydrolase-like enzyme